MLLLALDTSTRQASLALCSEDELLGEYTWLVGNKHSVELLNRIQRLLAESGKTMSDIDGVAVATGPGSFNGLRVAVSAAKALAFVLKKPLVGISTLDTIAAQQQQWEGPICSILEAGRSELYAACYLFDKIYEGSSRELVYRMRQLSDYLLLSPHQLANYLQEQASNWFGIPGERTLPSFLLCGEISAASRQALCAEMQEGCILINNVQASRHASVLAMLAMQRLHDGKEDDPLSLEPLYLRRPSITTSTRKQPLLGGKSQQSIGSVEASLVGTLSPGQVTQSERGEGAIRH